MEKETDRGYNISPQMAFAILYILTQTHTRGPGYDADHDTIMRIERGIIGGVLPKRIWAVSNS